MTRTELVSEILLLLLIMAVAAAVATWMVNAA